MKVIKYIFSFLVIFGLIFAIYFVFSKMKNRDNNVFISPLAETNTNTKKISAFSLENAPSESLKGEIITMTGDISWQGRTATEAAKILFPITIQQGEKLITGEKGSLSLTFDNACSVDLSEKTEFDIIQTLPANIVFSQTSGTGEYVKTGSYPVSIRALKLLAEVDGIISISIDSEKPIITLTVKSGNALIAYNDSKYISHEVSVGSNQSFSFNYDTKKGVLK